MEISALYIGFSLLVVLWAVRFFERFWLKPKRLEHTLRAQGLKGNTYRFPIGDARQFLKERKEGFAKPIALSHDIIPRIEPYVQKLMTANGKLSFTWFEQLPTVILNDPESVRYVLTKQQNILLKSKVEDSIKLLLPGLLALQGEKWTKHRRTLNPAFHLEKLKLMLPALSTSCDALIDKWDKLIDSKELVELDVLPEFKAFTGDAISRTAFGSSFEEGRRVFELLDELTHLVIESLQYFYIPFYIYLPTKINKRMKEITCEVDAILRDMIEQRENAIKKAEVTQNDLLGNLLVTNIRDAQEVGIKNAMTTQDVIDECKLFYVAGHETTMSSLTWTMVLLSMHTEWQEKARDEVLTLFGESKPSYDELNRLKIVPMIMNEVMRLYPPVSMLERRAATEVKIGEITYPAGVHFWLPVIFLHRDTASWGPDANEFNPERFADGISKASVPGAFVPFSAGPRVCIGQNFSILEAKLCIVRILQHFRFELSPAYTHAPHKLVTMQPQFGAQIIIRRR